jgi:hypothetical protein
MKGEVLTLGSLRGIVPGFWVSSDRTHSPDPSCWYKEYIIKGKWRWGSCDGDIVLASGVFDTWEELKDDFERVGDYVWKEKMYEG